MKEYPEIASDTVLPDDNGSMIATTGVEDVTMSEGTITFDIRFHAIVPRNGEIIGFIINVEAQNDFYPGYPLLKRAIYYCSRMISSQYGTAFEKARYDKIKKVYSIWICMNPPKNRENTITQYAWAEKNLIGNIREEEANYDLMAIIMICLGDADTSDSDILRLLDVLLSANTTVNQKRKIIEEDFDIAMTRTIERTVGFMCNLSKGVEDKAIERTLIAAISNLMDTMKWTIEQAMNALKIPEQEQEKYRDMIQ